MSSLCPATKEQTICELKTRQLRKNAYDQDSDKYRWGSQTTDLDR